MAMNESKQQGFILLAVLWVTALLAMFALNYAASARMSGLAVQLSRDISNDHILLRSALERGRHEYLKYRANKGLLEDKDFLEWITGEPLKLLHPRYEAYRIQVDGVAVDLRIVNDSAWLNVNHLPPALLERILAACGLGPGRRITEIVNSLQDWIDPDDLHRAEGAETPYYMALDRPYFAKNSGLQSVEELLLIKGIDLELYLGSEDRPGLVDFLNVSGQGTKIDVNSASPRAFALIDGFPDEAVQEIVALRQESPIRSMDDLLDVVPQRYFSQFSELFGVVEASSVRIQAALVREDGRPGRSLEMTVTQ